MSHGSTARPQQRESLTRAQADALAAQHGGRIERQAIKVPVENKHVTDYSCDPCRAGDHHKCQPTVHYPDWQFDCGCYESTPHVRVGDVLIIPLAEETQS
ncbi:hypothetical protein [Ornithinimicrobium murale]|uniref:hypothetical protein n=1 Tax=Ornithinimicrobium murale TaxID=1050153 RepID=UPI0013B3FAE7|nr:hypothetical protein [Ornithinimicrobium murale]